MMVARQCHVCVYACVFPFGKGEATVLFAALSYFAMSAVDPWADFEVGFSFLLLVSLTSFTVLL